MTVRQILKRKGNSVATVNPDASISAALESLAAHGIGALVVTESERKVAGILSERDIVRGLSSSGAGALDMKVADLMTTEVHTCTEASTTAELMNMMTSQRFRHVPVVEDGELVGIVSIGDVVNSRLNELESEARHLTNYISGR